LGGTQTGSGLHYRRRRGRIKEVRTPGGSVITGTEVRLKKSEGGGLQLNGGKGKGVAKREKWPARNI